MGLFFGPKSRRQKSGPYYSIRNFVYGFQDRLRFPEIGPYTQHGLVNVPVPQ